MLIPRSPRSSSPTPDDKQLLDKSYLLTTSPGKKQPRILGTSSATLYRPEDGRKVTLTDVSQSHWPSDSMPPTLLSSPTLLQFAEPFSQITCASKSRSSSLPMAEPVPPSEGITHSFSNPPSPSSRSSRKRSSSYNDDNRFEYDLMHPIPVREIAPKRRRLSVRQPYGGPRACASIRSFSLPDNRSEFSKTATFVDEATSSHPEANRQMSFAVHSKLSFAQSSHSNFIPPRSLSSDLSFTEQERHIHPLPFRPGFSSVDSVKTLSDPGVSNNTPSSGEMIPKKALSNKKSRGISPRHYRKFKLSSSKANGESCKTKTMKPGTAFLAKLCNQLKPGKVYRVP
ncbi:hypothetical protein CPB83DRAFT_583717 [Crepidotus variabilis]|uniref:Uncharacterized protein n=1 Tax=Crepidotus variabilis TaxID=179855 RepID=A0A9P6JTV4_9AGAR|nr:hypothetical protein CPB83DRAFT_583717 [Crepidotus variabilis]